MGSFLDKPKTEKTNDHGHGNELRYGLAAMQGWRVEMEDAHSSVTGLPAGLDGWSFFAVFDGHAGGTVSKHSSKDLLQSILDADAPLFAELAQMYTHVAPKHSTTSVNGNSTNSKSPVSSPRSSTSSISPTKPNNTSPTQEAAKNSQNSTPAKPEE